MKLDAYTTLFLQQKQVYETLMVIFHENEERSQKYIDLRETDTIKAINFLSSEIKKDQVLSLLFEAQTKIRDAIDLLNA
jgi:hypothetical protein